MLGMVHHQKRVQDEKPHLHLTSVLTIEKLKSSIRSNTLSSTGFVKLGHPEPESNLSSELNNILPQHIQAYCRVYKRSCTYPSVEVLYHHFELLCKIIHLNY